MADDRQGAERLAARTPEATVPVVAARPRWGSRPLDERVLYFWESPSVQVWFKRKGRTLSVGYRHLGAGAPLLEGSPPRPPDDLAWTRLALGTPLTNVALEPVLPERPILFGLATPVTLRAGASTSVFIEAPILLRFSDPRGEDETLLEIPSAPFEKAWFGPSTGEGQLCLWRKEEAVLTAAEARADADSVSCPITIRNDGDRDLGMTTLLLRGAALTVFAVGDFLWSDETSIVYAGEKHVSRVTVAGRPPAPAQGAVRVGRPRVSSGLVQAALQGTWEFFTTLSA